MTIGSGSSATAALCRVHAALGLIVLLGTGACHSRPAAPSLSEISPRLTAVVDASLDGGAAAVLGFDPTALDRAVAPCEDFYQHACGGWLARTPIPPDRAAWTRSFSVIQERNEDIIHGILDAYAAGHVNAGEPDAHRVGDFYASCMDEPMVERAGQEALSNWMARDPRQMRRG